MNRVQLVQVIVVIAAIVFGYQMINTFIVFTTNVIDSFFSEPALSYRFTISYAVMPLLYAIGLVLILNHATGISMWIVSKIHPDESIALQFSDSTVIYAVLLHLLLGTLIKNIPAVIYETIEYIRINANANNFSGGFTNRIFVLNDPQLIEAILAFILLINVKGVVTYFHKKIDPKDPHTISYREEFEPGDTDIPNL